MTKATQTISILIVLASSWFALFLGYAPIPTKVQDDVVPYLPFWALVSFGAYLLFKLGWGVFTFNDVPDAYKELMGQIDQAKTELRAKGVTVD